MTKPIELYACLYAREFPAQALLRLRPELRSKPCVVMKGEAPLYEVCSITRKARRMGIVNGMTQVEVDTFSGVTVLQRSAKEETAAQDVLLECVGCFSPRVQINPRNFSFCCVLDIAGTEALFGPPDELACSLLTRVNALGVTACVTVSTNFHSAVSLAKGLSTQNVKVIPDGDERTALAPLPLSVLDLTEDQIATFALWGIGTLGMLAELPERELISRLGQSGKRLRQFARGEATHLFQPVEPAFKLQESMELDSPVEMLDALMFVASLMLEHLILRASARALALASVSITLTLNGGATHARTIRTALSTNDRAIWLKLLHLDLEAHPPQAAVLAVALDAEPGSTSQTQLGLFSPQLPEPSRLDVTLARIRAIVGDENVGCAALTDTHQLDGFRIDPFRVSSSEPSKISFRCTHLAVRRIRPAETISVTCQAAYPIAFMFQNRRYSVERAYGPWLTSGEWWSTTRWKCEQWDIMARARDDTTLCCRMNHDLLRKEWQIEALYD